MVNESLRKVTDAKSLWKQRKEVNRLLGFEKDANGSSEKRLVTHSKNYVYFIPGFQNQKFTASLHEKKKSFDKFVLLDINN